jgi:hypothetical protein
MARVVYEYGKTTYAGYGKGSVPGIEDCIGSVGIPLLAERFANLNFRYLVAAFY